MSKKIIPEAPTNPTGPLTPLGERLKNAYPQESGRCPGFTKKDRIVHAEFFPRLKIPEGVRFIYFGRPAGNNRHHGVMTVAYQLDKQQRQVSIGFSFCSPKDRWVKTIGQELALRRLKEGIIFAPYLYQPHQLVVQIARALMEHRLLEVNNVCSYYQPVSSPPQGSGGVARLVPGWVRDLAERLFAPKLTSSKIKRIVIFLERLNQKGSL